MLIDKNEAKKRLAVVWFVGVLILLTVLLGQTARDVYIDPAKAWGWFLPTVMPTLSLVAGVLVADARGTTVDVQMVDRFFYRFALWASVIYLLVVSFSILAGPFRASPDELMDLSSLWLGPLQGLVAATIGIFFVHKGETSAEQDRPASEA